MDETQGNASADGALVPVRSPKPKGGARPGAGRPGGLSRAEIDLRRLTRTSGHRLLPVVVRNWRDVLALKPLVLTRLRSILENPNADPSIVLMAGKLIERVQENVADRFGLPRRAEFDGTLANLHLTPELIADALRTGAQLISDDPARGAVQAVDAEYEVHPATNGDGTTVQ